MITRKDIEQFMTQMMIIVCAHIILTATWLTLAVTDKETWWVLWSLIMCLFNARLAYVTAQRYVLARDWLDTHNGEPT